MTATPGFVHQHVAQLIPLDQITASRTNPRKHFDATAMKELTESVRKHGVMQPVLVRPHGTDGFELVAGERRFRAAQGAELGAIPALVRALTDAEALELQVVENLQRQDLHPLEEAEGYEQLLKLPGYTADDIAAKVGKSRAYIYGRMKLCALCPKARQAFYKGLLNPSTALLIARIPVAKLQEEATAMITARDDPWSYRQAAEHVHERYMLRLKEAPFKTGDAVLLPKAGACTVCPKRTGNQPELFGDVKSADVCTDPTCFAEKSQAHGAQLHTAAIERGQTVISGKEAKKLKPSQWGDHIADHVRLDARCYDDAKQRTYRKILDKDCPAPVLLEDPHQVGNFIEILPLKEANLLIAQKLGKALATLRRTDGADMTYYRVEERKREAKAKLENEIRQAIFTAVRDKVSVPLDRDSFNTIALALYEDMPYDNRKHICALWGWNKQTVPAAEDPELEVDVDPADGDDDDGPRIAKLADTELLRLLVDLSLVEELQCDGWDNSQPTKLNAAADRFSVDHARIRAELTHDAKARGKAKAKKSAKKPPAKTNPPAEV